MASTGLWHRMEKHRCRTGKVNVLTTQSESKMLLTGDERDHCIREAETQGKVQS